MKDIIKSNKIFLAPLAGITDRAFRSICKEYGCDFVTTEMVSAKGLFYNNKSTQEMLLLSEAERPAAIQIFGSEQKIMADMAAKIEREYKPEAIDINMGCPAHKIVKNGEGSALMKNPKLIGEIVNCVSRAVNIPVTIKIRKGFDNNSVNAVEIAKIAEENGAAAITVHGRTREQYYSGKADWEIIALVKESVSIPVIGNGDVVDGSSAANMLKYTNCDAIMIGRAARGNPWIFSEIQHYLKTGNALASPPVYKKMETVLKHLQLLISLKGEFISVREMRKHLNWYIKGMDCANKLRIRINTLETYEEAENLINEICSKSN